MSVIARTLWGKKARLSILFIAAIALLFPFLATREIWTQEHRWADIVKHMFETKDFFHPVLNGKAYYDKPLMSYWLIAGCATLLGKLSTWALRLPSAITGLISIAAIYNLGKSLKDRELGLLASWMLLSTFYFLFWARTGNAEMLNMAGILCAVSWYFTKKTNPSFFNYLIFFLIIAITSLCKGLVAPVVVGLAILPDVLSRGEWRKHLRISLFISLIPAIIIYLLPFWASTNSTQPSGYSENGLMLVWQENFVRYFQPFDHKGPIYTYLIFLPVYLLPWALFFIPAIKNLPKLKLGWSVLLLFIFFTASGSRRNYYILSVVPFALIMTADWILTPNTVRQRYAAICAGIFLPLLFIFFIILQPIYYKNKGLEKFTTTVKQEAKLLHPWKQWQIVLLDPESKIRFYLELPANTPLHGISGDKRTKASIKNLKQIWPKLSNNKTTIYISRKKWKAPLQKLLGNNYQLIETHQSRWHKTYSNQPIAFIPKK